MKKQPTQDEVEVPVPVPKGNDDILLGIGIALVGGYIFVSQILPRLVPEDNFEEYEIPQRIAAPNPSQPLSCI